MKVDDNPFLGDQNMVDAGLFKGKTKVLTSTKSKEARTVDLKMHILADEYKEIRRRRAEQKSRYEQGKMSKAETTMPRVTSRILLNKWQWQKEKDYQRWLKDQAYQH
jgi:predicted methyltransferase